MRILVITHTFPPSPSSNAKRPAYVVQALLDQGWRVDLVTSKYGLEADVVETMGHANLRIIRVGDFVLWLHGRVVRPARLRRWVQLLSNGLLWPDVCAPWARAVFRRYRKHIADYDRVLAFVFPPAMLLSGSYPGLVDDRWVFDFQESVSPQFSRYPRGSPLQRALTGRLARLERKTLHQAGRVIFTAEANREAYLAQGLVPSEITEHIPYFYDDAAFAEDGGLGKGFEIGYYGTFDLRGHRNPITFLRAFDRFLRRHPESRSESRFVFHGDWLPEHTAVISELELDDVCEIRGGVPYPEYIAKIKRSPVLLLVVAEAHNLFMPSKIVDYLGARRPILGLVPAGSEMERVLKDAGMGDFVCGESDVEACSQVIGNLWRHHLEGRLGVDSQRTGKWSSAVQMPRYLAVLAPNMPPINPFSIVLQNQ